MELQTGVDHVSDADQRPTLPAGDNKSPRSLGRSLLFAASLTVGLAGTLWAQDLEVPFFSQRDPAWSGNSLGTCADTVGTHGCFTTSKAMVFNYYQSGYTNPGTLNACLTSSGGYSAGCLADWANADACAPSGVAYQGQESGNLSALSASIDAELAAGYPVLADVRYNNYSCGGSTGQHMVVLTGKSGSTYAIRDPWATTDTPRTLSSPALGSAPYVLCKIRKYHGPANLSRVATGDWDGDGNDEIWRFQQGQWTILRANGSTVTTFSYGLPGDWPVVGDFDGNGQDDYGVFRPGTNPSRFHLVLDRDRSADWAPPLAGPYPQDIPVVGDWDGDGDDDLGAWDSDTRIFWLFTLASPTSLPDFDHFQMGNIGDLPVAGNWDGSGGDEVGTFRRGEPNANTNTYYFRRSDDVRISLASLGEPNGYGDSGDLPIVGDWNGDGYDTIGVYRPSTQQPYTSPDLPHLTPSSSAPSVVTNLATAVLATSATLNGNVNPNGASTSAYFRFGPTTSYGSSTSVQSMGSGTSNIAFSASITGLQCNTVYHFKAVASNAAGAGAGADRTLVTGACAVTPSLQILVPGAGVTWAIGAQKTISWSASNLSPSAVVGLWFYDGTDFHHIDDVPPTQTSYQWALPQTSATQGQIYIWSVVGGTPEADDWSDTFGITPGSSSPPFGSFDTPAHGTVGVTGATAVTGWALDDVEVTRVEIYRNALSGEPTAPNGKVYVGDATFVPGARPDVAGAYAGYPFASRAGWGYMLLTNFLPNGGNGTTILYAYANDADSHATLLGSKTITCSNATATKPFGTIDTPAQGETVSGTIVNYGWALTPQSASIPTNGSTITVFVDGVPVGHPAYNQYRSDIATLFPGYANSNGAVGYWVIDTRALSNGLHTIAWSVTDNMGHSDGIGSRYFWVQN